jgi:PRC-barrel domain
VENLMRTMLISACLASAIVGAPLALAQSGSKGPGPSATEPGTAAPSAPTAPANPAPQSEPKPQVAVSALTDKDLLAAAGTELGDIERVVESRSDQKRYVVVSRGGFLGFFEKQFLVPVDSISVQDGRVLARDLSEAQLTQLPQYSGYNNDFRELESTQTVAVAERR